MQIASAVQMNGGKSNLNLNRHWLGTAKIGQILPIFHQECVPGDKFNVHIGSFARFLPLAVPSYVNLTYRTLSVFVPYHQVFDGAESFFSNQASFRRSDNSLPSFTLANLLGAFVSSNTDLWATDLGSSIPASYDFYSGGKYWSYNAKGWYVVKLLHSLGYRFSNNGSAVSRTYNALPLLAFCHAYNSYLAYSPDVNTSQLSYELEQQKRAPSRVLSAAILHTLLGSILLTYEESFYSLAWRQPYYSQPQQSPQIAFPDFEQRTKNVAGGNSAILYDGQLGGKFVVADGDDINAAQVRLLMKFDDFFRRSNYAGSKDIEQIYSRFGVKIDDYKTRYPYFLNETGQNVKIGDVTSTADTSATSPVGAYAGKAISSDDAGFNFESHDYGMIFTFAWYAPKIEYYLGADKETLRLQPFDFYTPELDEGFPSALTRQQLDAAALGNGPDTTFGYVPLYSEYLYANSIIVGEFERRSGFEAWHFGRNFNLAAAAQADSFIYIPCTGTPLERIFNVTDPTMVDVDSIYLECNVDCSAVRPMKDFVGKTRLGEGSLDIPQLGYQAN